MNDIKLDLDVYAPKPEYAQLGGKAIEIYPPKLKTIVKLLAIFERMSKAEADEDKSKAFAELTELLLPIVPALKEPDVDLTFEQMGALIKFVFEMSQPKDGQALKAEGIELTGDGNEEGKKNPTA